MEELTADLQKAKTDIGDLGGEASLKGVADSVDRMLMTIDVNKKLSKALIDGMSRSDMTKLQTALATKNGDLKVNTFKSIIFKTEMAALKRNDDQVIKMKEILRVISKYILIVGHGSSSGDISWDAIIEVVADAIQEHDQNVGSAMRA